MYLKTQKFLVAGISRSGVAAARLLLSHRAATYVYDETINAATEKNLIQLKSLGATVVTAETLKTAQETCDILVLSPGIPIDHPLPVAFKKAGKKIVGEMELGALFLKANAVAVTGTNGKTTTVGLLKEILQRSGKKVIACGNVGRPLCDCVEELDREDIAVIEVSSFQLESLSSLRAHVCIELNITQDHLNRHYNMENYIFLKGKLLKNSAESEYAVLNYDDETVRGFAIKTRARTVWFSLKDRVDGAYLYDGELFWRDEKIISVKQLPMSGMHNIANTLAAICAAKLFGLDCEAIAEGIKSFKGIRHRIESVAEINGVIYINDSKATNVDATVKALESIEGETVLLLGGKDKGYDYEFLFEKIKRANVVQAILYGENRFKLLTAAVRSGFQRTALCPEFEMAVRFSSIIARRGQNVLLSPASSSFDAFTGYEERGERFTEMVKAMINSVENKAEENSVQAVENVAEEREE